MCLSILTAFLFLKTPNTGTTAPVAAAPVPTIVKILDKERQNKS